MEESIFVEYSEQSQACHVLPEMRKLIVSHDVQFMDESAFDREHQEFLEKEKENISSDHDGEELSEDE